MTDEQLQIVISFKVKQATEPLEQRWETLRKIVTGWKSQADSPGGKIAYGCVLGAIDELEKHHEPRRKLPTDPRRKNKLDK
jgi:hypothetical protein